MNGQIDTERARELERLYAQSPLHLALGLRMEVENDSAVIRYDGAAGGRNRRGNTAGATTAAMIDSVVMQSAMLHLTEADGISTIELKVNFLRAGAEGEELLARGRLIHLGRSTAVGFAEVFDTAGRPVAAGTATVSIRRAA